MVAKGTRQSQQPCGTWQIQQYCQLVTHRPARTSYAADLWPKPVASAAPVSGFIVQTLAGSCMVYMWARPAGGQPPACVQRNTRFVFETTLDR
jgi:hypothetical protein